jgi:hypothetical protein
MVAQILTEMVFLTTMILVQTKLELRLYQVAQMQMQMD